MTTLGLDEKIGRPVRAVSIGFRPGLPLDRIATLVDQEGSRGADIIVLPETCRGQDEASAEPLDGPTITAISGLARKHKTYIVCPIDRSDGRQRFNSAVLLDRQGRVVSVYDKIFPLWHDEGRAVPPVLPGKSAVVCPTDFGRVGLAICFDVNWSDLWEQLARQGAELVIWPSAYSGGRRLQARAVDNHYYVMSASWIPDCRVYDIDGEPLAYECDNRGDGTNLTRVLLDLDRCIFHQDLNYPARLELLLREQGAAVKQAKQLPLEAWFILQAKQPGVSARAVAKKYGLEELRDYLRRGREEIDKHRGCRFSAVPAARSAAG
jgi:predicted amidohydrolase